MRRLTFSVRPLDALRSIPFREQSKVADDWKYGRKYEVLKSDSVPKGEAQRANRLKVGRSIALHSESFPHKSQSPHQRAFRNRAALPNSLRKTVGSIRC